MHDHIQPTWRFRVRCAPTSLIPPRNSACMMPESSLLGQIWSCIHAVLLPSHKCHDHGPQWQCGGCCRVQGPLTRRLPAAWSHLVPCALKASSALLQTRLLKSCCRRMVVPLAMPLLAGPAGMHLLSKLFRPGGCALLLHYSTHIACKEQHRLLTYVTEAGLQCCCSDSLAFYYNDVRRIISRQDWHLRAYPPPPCHPLYLRRFT